MKEIRSFVLVFLVAFCWLSVIGQQRPIQSLYMFDHLVINPAYAGSAVQLSATVINRNQWVNFPGAPETTTFTLHSGFFKSRIGLGIMIARDKIGVHEDYSVYFSYSYKIKLPIGTLSMGLQGGFNNLSSDFNDLKLRSSVDPSLAGRRIKFSPNFGAGVYLNNDLAYAGLSVPYLLNDKIVDLEGVLSAAKRRRNYYITGGLRRQISENVKFLPSVLVRLQEGAPLNYDINAHFVLYETVGLGMSYRNQDAVVFLFELAINENFHVGYAYDYTTSALREFSNGSHEIMINYRIRIPKLHKGLECPSYY